MCKVFILSIRRQVQNDANESDIGIDKSAGMHTFNEYGIVAAIIAPTLTNTHDPSLTINRITGVVTHSSPRETSLLENVKNHIIACEIKAIMQNSAASTGTQLAHLGVNFKKTNAWATQITEDIVTPDKRVVRKNPICRLLL